MIKAHLHLIKYALAKGYNISVHDGEEWAVTVSTAYEEIKGAIDSVEQSEIIIENWNGERRGWALIIDQGTPSETVSDYTCTAFMETWDGIYMDAVDRDLA
jgi:hypothetical protein